MVEQLSMEQYLFESESVEESNDVPEEKPQEVPKEPIPDFNVGDTVNVVAKSEDATDIEDEGYLQVYEGKSGTLVRINERSNPTCYEVDFGGNERSVRNGLFYAKQIKRI